MARFTIRVELHDASWEHYTKLHAQLAARGITDVITDSNGARWKLPPAEYNYDGNLTLPQVLQRTEEAAKLVGKTHAVLVTESAGRTWSGLQQVR